MKISELVGDLSYKEIKERKWRIPIYYTEEGKAIKFRNYSISNDGIIIRITSSSGTYVGKVLKAFKNKKTGYLFYNLYFNGKNFAPTKHRLMYGTWVKKIKKGLTINHKDGIKENCNLLNLEQMSLKENINHAINLGLAWTKQHRKNMSKVHKWKPLSKEHRKKIGASNLGRKCSKEFVDFLRKKAKVEVKQRKRDAYGKFIKMDKEN